MLTDYTVEGPYAWVTVPRWRIMARSKEGRVYTFTMYSASQPTLEEANTWFATNGGSALDITPGQYVEDEG